MSFVLDMLHMVAAILLAVIGISYEREEECDPVHLDPAGYTIETSVDGRVTYTSDVVFVTQNGVLITDAEPTPASDCDREDAAIVYPVL